MKKISLFTIASIILATLLSCNVDSSGDMVSLESPATQRSELPFLYSDNSGELFLSWVDAVSDSDEYRLKYSKWVQGAWSESREIARSNEWFVNWADYPSITAYSGKALAAHVLRKVPGNTYSYNVNISLNKDSTWTEPFPPHNDSTATEHGFVSMVALNNSEVMATWLDGRRTENREDSEYFDLSKAMTLRSAVINNSGDVSSRKLLDDSVCDCCQTSMVMTEEGPFVAYRNRTDEEVRDIYYSRYVSGEWSDPRPVHSDNWKIGACPVNGPRVAAKDSLVVVSWFTKADNVARVKAAVSTNYGASFNEPIVVSEDSTSGRVDVAIGKNGVVYVSDLIKDMERYYLSLHEVDYIKGTVTTRNITEMSGSRRSGFPQMEIIDNTLFFAWTEITDDTLTHVQSASLDI